MKRCKRLASAVGSVLLTGALVLGMVPAELMAAPEKEASDLTQRGYDGALQNVYQPGGGAIYYVDSENGNDDNAGTSKDQAFKSLAKVNAITLSEGDSILLKKGSIFEKQQLAPKGRGTEERHILIGTYGEGEMPVINTRFEYREAILIENMEYVDITGIEVTNDDVFNKTSEVEDKNNQKNTALVNGKKFRPLGVHILINEDAKETFKGDGDAERVYKGVNLDGCYIHDVDGDENYNTNKLSGGIGIEIKYHNKNKIYPVFDGVTVQNNRIDQVDRCGIKAIRLTELDQNNGNGEEVGGDGERSAGVRREGRNQASLNYVVRNNYLTDIGGDGILVDSTRGALVENNLMYNHTMRATGANAGIWSWNAFDTTFQYNECYGGPVNNQDGCSYDSDYLSAGTIFQYNYSHDCKLGFMLVMGNNDTDIIRYNLSQNDGNVFRHIVAGSNTPSYVYNNVFYYNGDKWRFVNNNTPDDSTTDSIRTNWQYFNNIFYNTSETTPSNWKIGDWEKAMTGNNMVYEASGKYGAQEIPNAIHADPMFEDPGKGAANDGKGNTWSSLDCYKLQEGSPAIGAGTYVDVKPQTTGGNAGCWDAESDRNASEDFYGNALYQGAPDIGIEESDKQGADFAVEANAIYHILNPSAGSYLSMTQGTDELTVEERTNENQGFTALASGKGYKFRIWDETSSVYRYLAVEDGALKLSEAAQTVWSVNDLKNGLYNLAADGQNLTCSEGVLSLAADNGDTVSAQWYLEMDEHSHSYNVGGKEIEGFSADQVYKKSEKQSGSYTENTRFTANADVEVYKTGVRGTEIGYKIYATDGEYTLKLYFTEPDSTDKDRTFDILVNGKTVEEAYVLDKDTKELTITGIYPKDGLLDVKLQSAYNDSGKKEEAVLSGITAEKQIRKEAESRINAGGEAADGLAADAQYSSAAGAGYYGESNVMEAVVTNADPDAGLGTVMTTAREGAAFGYKVKAMPGSYRVKLYFAESDSTDHTFDIGVNGKTVKENYNVKTEAEGADKTAAFVYETEAKDGFVDVLLTGKNGSNAMVNAVVIEAYSRPSGEKMTVTASSESENAQLAVDGNAATRFVGENSITLIMEEKHILNGLVLDWVPNQRADAYHIDVSEDGENFETAVMASDAAPGLNVHTFDSTVAKAVRVVADNVVGGAGISLTEAELYGGAAVSGEAASTASSRDVKGGNTDVTAGMGYVYKRYSTAEVRLQYHPEEVEFVADSLTYLNEEKLDYIADAADEGLVSVRLGMKKWDGFKEADNEIVKARFKNLTDSMAEVTVTVLLTSADGHITELPSAKAYLPADADYTLLSKLLKEAKELAATAEAGEGRGQYPQASVDTLNAAIALGDQCSETGEQSEFNEAARALYNALNLMKETLIDYTKTMYHKDFTDSKETAPAVTAGTSEVKDGRWNLKLGNGEASKITDAAAIDHGYYYARLNLDNVTDQNLFSIIGEDETRRIRTGWEASHWFWDGAISGWGEWNGGDNIAAGEDFEIMMKFDSSADDVNYASLWINGQKVSDKTLSYVSGTGLPAFETRNSGKTFRVAELYYTDAEPVTIHVSASKGGTVSQTGAVTSFMEADKTFTFTPDEGESITGVKVDGQEVEIADSYTFEYLQGDHTLEVTFSGAEEEAKSYHADYLVDTEADFDGAFNTEVADGALKMVVNGTGDNQQVVTTAADKNAPELSSGTFYTRFSVDSSEVNDVNGKDQVIFDVKKNGDSAIRIGFDYLSPSSETGNWFFDKAQSGQGWGNFSNGGGVAPLTENEDHTLRLDFTETSKDIYTLHLTVDGADMGSVTDVKYAGGAGTYGFAARRTTKNYTVKEVYYSNAAEYVLTVTGTEHGTISQMGELPTFAGTDKTIQFIPEDGYRAVVAVDGVQADVKENQYTFENIQGNHTLDITFTDEAEAPEEAVTYHQDYNVNTEAAYEGNLLTGSKVEEGSLKLNLADGTDENFAIAMDTNAPELSEGTFYTRFTVDSITDQMLFDVKTDGTSDGSTASYIRLGFETDPDSGRAAWFYDKASSGDGYGDFPEQSAKLVAGQENEVKLQFTKNSAGNYDLTLTVNGQSCGTVSDVNFGESKGKFAFGSRRKGKNIEVKEVYYTNDAEYTINVTAGENGSVSQTGNVTVFGGSSKVLFVHPKEGYEIDKVLVNGTETEISENQYTFENITGDQTFEVTFKEIKEEVTDKTALRVAVDGLSTLVETDYTKASYDALLAAKTAAEEVLIQEEATQEMVDEALINLNSAKDGLVSVKALKEAIDGLNELKEENYTADSWQILAAAKAEAQLVLEKEDAGEDEINYALTAIADAKAQLEAKPEAADKEALQNAVTALGELTEADYTEESWAALMAAKDAAQDVLDQEDAVQASIDHALETLNNARNALVKNPVPAADKTALQAAFDKASALNEADYTAESFRAVTDAKAAAQEILGKADAAQDEVDVALAALNEAMAGLEKNPDKNPEPSPKPDPEPTPDPEPAPNPEPAPDPVPTPTPDKEPTPEPGPAPSEQKNSITAGTAHGKVSEVTVEGEFAADAILQVTHIAVEADIYNDMLKELPENAVVLGAYEVEITGEANGPFTLSFHVGTEYNGKKAIVVHVKDDGTAEKLEAVVENGIVKVKADSLSPFMIALADDGEKKGAQGGQNASGDNAGNKGTKTGVKAAKTSDDMNAGAALFGMIMAAGAILLMKKRR